MSLTKLPLAENNLIFPVSDSLVSDIPARDGKNDNLFFDRTLFGTKPQSADPSPPSSQRREGW